MQEIRVSEVLAAAANATSVNETEIQLCICEEDLREFVSLNADERMSKLLNLAEGTDGEGDLKTSFLCNATNLWTIVSPQMMEIFPRWYIEVLQSTTEYMLRSAYQGVYDLDKLIEGFDSLPKWLKDKAEISAMRSKMGSMQRVMDYEAAKEFIEE